MTTSGIKVVSIRRVKNSYELRVVSWKESHHDHQEVWFPGPDLITKWSPRARYNEGICSPTSIPHPVLICHSLDKCIIHEYYLMTCLGVSFQDSLDNSITCECMPEETESSENSPHPDFAKVIRLTFCYTNNLNYLLVIVFMEKTEMLYFKI